MGFFDKFIKSQKIEEKNFYRPEKSLSELLEKAKKENKESEDTKVISSIDEALNYIRGTMNISNPTIKTLINCEYKIFTFIKGFNLGAETFIENNINSCISTMEQALKSENNNDLKAYSREFLSLLIKTYIYTTNAEIKAFVNKLDPETKVLYNKASSSIEECLQTSIVYLSLEKTNLSVNSIKIENLFEYKIKEIEKISLEINDKNKTLTKQKEENSKTILGIAKQFVSEIVTDTESPLKEYELDKWSIEEKEKKHMIPYYENLKSLIFLLDKKLDILQPSIHIFSLINEVSNPIANYLFKNKLEKLREDSNEFDEMLDLGSGAIDPGAIDPESAAVQMFMKTLNSSTKKKLKSLQEEQRNLLNKMQLISDKYLA